MNCLFCSIISKEIPSEFIYDTKDFIVIKDIHPQASVHLLIIPKVHYEEFLDMPKELLTELTDLAKQVIKEQHIASYRLVNNGKGAAYINHFHLHILGNVDKQ